MANITKKLFTKIKSLTKLAIRKLNIFSYFRLMILVTGGTGLVGSHLLYHLLLENNTVKAIHQRTSDLSAVKKVFGYYENDIEPLFDRIEWVEADICDVPSLQKAFEGVSYVYHCAALISMDPSDYQKMRRVNIEGTTNIVNQCIGNAVKKICYVSSIAAVEKNTNGLPTDETENWNGSLEKSGYAITKYGAEMEVWRASQEGVNVSIVNPGVILGSGFWEKSTGKMFSQINNGLNFYTTGVNGFVGVKDVVKALIVLMKVDIKNERYILVSENISFKDVFFKIADGLSKKRPNFQVTPFLSQIAWRWDVLKSMFTRNAPLMNKNTAKTILAKEYYSSEKIRKAFNYEFEGMDKTIKSICADFLKD